MKRDFTIYVAKRKGIDQLLGYHAPDMPLWQGFRNFRPKIGPAMTSLTRIKTSKTQKKKTKSRKLVTLLFKSNIVYYALFNSLNSIGCSLCLYCTPGPCYYTNPWVQSLLRVSYPIVLYPYRECQF